MSTEAPAAPGHAHGDHPAILGHHFDDIEQQRSAMRLGMWLFLVTELLFFGGVFVAYTAYRIWYPEAWAAASSKLNPLIAGINSFLLLTSSLTVTIAIYRAKAGNNAGLKSMLMATWVLGVTFLAFKGIEYRNDYVEGLVPGSMFNHEMFAEGVDTKKVQLFFVFYYCMTGIHVIHLIIGVGLVAWIWMEARRNEITKERYTKVEVISLYWHFVDLIWLFIVPCLYLAGTHSTEQLQLWVEAHHHG